MHRGRGPTSAETGMAARSAARGEQGTVPRSTERLTGPARPTAARGAGTRQLDEPAHTTRIGTRARDVDFGMIGARNFVLGGGISGLLAILCAAALVTGAGTWTWVWQLVFGGLFLWFLSGARESLRGRGLLVDDSGLYWRYCGAVHPVTWSEIAGVGIGTQPWSLRRPVRPDRRQALEIYPGDPAFAARHPELEAWRVEETAPVAGLPSVRYRFSLPPAGRLSKHLERAVRGAHRDVWVGRYRRDG